MNKRVNTCLAIVKSSLPKKQDIYINDLTQDYEKIMLRCTKSAASFVLIKTVVTESSSY